MVFAMKSLGSAAPISDQLRPLSLLSTTLVRNAKPPSTPASGSLVDVSTRRLDGSPRSSVRSTAS
jgi:hypothetical protein